MFLRYLAGDGTAQERAAFDARLGTQPELAALVEEVRTLRFAPGNTGPVDVGAALARFGARIQDDGGERSGAFRPPSLRQDRILGKHPLRTRILAGAGAALGVIATIFAIRSSAPSHPGHVYRAAVGQRTTVTLEDGSVVTLAPGAVLRTGGDFAATSRTVALDGQALFDVRSQTGAPFHVHTRTADVIVLGTVFAITYDDAAHQMVVGVASGKVSVRATGRAPEKTSATTLSMGEIGHVTDSAVVVSRPPDLAPYTEWAHGTFVFDNTPLPNVLATLGRWYGADIRLAPRDSAVLTGRTITVSFAEQSLADALTTLKVLMQLDVTYDDSTILIRAADKKSVPAPHRERPIPGTKTLMTSEVGR